MNPPPSPPPPPSADGASAPSADAPRPRKSRHLVPADSLLTFHSYTPPRPSRASDTPRRRAAGAAVSVPRRARDAFVQANYRFAVSPVYPPGYAECTALCTAVVPWEAVDLVFVPGRDACPICLHRPRCPRVTPCGHVFDFVCLLQHMVHAGAGKEKEDVAKCPMCGMRVSRAELRMCVFGRTRGVQVGVVVEMALVARERGSCVVRVRGEEGRVPVVDAEGMFTRLGVADEAFLMRMMEDQLADLQRIAAEESHLRPFVAIAVADVEENRAQVLARRGRKSTIDYAAPARAGDMRVFYQARDTQNVFLHPVNHRCLSTEYAGDFAHAQPRISGVVLEIERHTMDEALRKKYRFLDHLPDGCEFAFVELDINHVLSQKTLDAHAVELKSRKTSRKRRETKDRKESIRIERKKTESLQSYFCSQGASLTRRPRSPEQIDSRDTKSFPALGVGGDTPVGQGAEENGVTAGVEAESGTDAAAASAPTSTAGPVCGSSSASGSASASTHEASDVSSYSSVTSKMGLFPSLGRATAEAGPDHSSFPTLGDANMGGSLEQGGSRSAWFPTRAASQSKRGEQEMGQSAGWGRESGECESGRAEEVSQGGTGKRGKRSHRKTTIMSNASVVYRR